MRTPVLVTSLFALAAPALADGPAFNEANIPVAETKPLANDPHAAHARCHGPFHSWYSECASIRSYEQNKYKSDAATGTATVVDAQGLKSTGKRDVYNTANVTYKLTSEVTYSAKAWLARYNPQLYLAPQSAHPEWETATIDSCDQYVYKRYYQANRQLDAIGTLSAANRFYDAVDVILRGVPANGSVKGFSPVSTTSLYDYDGRVVTEFRDIFNGPPVLAVSVPASRNPFFQLPTKLINSVPRLGQKWETLIPEALTASTTRTFDGTDKWSYAETMRNHPDVLNLSPGERDDVANRVGRMRNAVGRALKTFEKCTTDRFEAQTASTTQLPNGQTFAEYVANITYDGVRDPLDLTELSLVAQLVDEDYSASTLDTLLKSSATSSYALTRTGRLLRGLAALNLPALQQTVSATKYSFTSGTWSGCNGAFYDVAKYLVEEYQRGTNGCMNVWTKKCDFSMPLYARDVADQLTARVSDLEAAKTMCLTYLGSDFNSTLNPVPSTVRKDLTTFELYLKNRKAQIDHIIRNTPRASELPSSIGDRRGALSYFGDPNRFGAGYAYEAEWGVNVIQRTSAGEPCRLGGQVEGRLNAWVNLFGASRSLVDAGLKVRTEQTDKTLSAAEKAADFNMHVNLLGIDLYRTPEDAAIPNGAFDPIDNTQSFNVPVVKTTVLLGFIPVTIDAGFGFEYGYRINGAFIQSPCQAVPTLKLSGNVEPFAGANAYLSAYVDLFVVGAGVKGELTLLEAKLPFDATLEVKPDTATGGYLVDASSSLNLHLTLLSGNISFVVKVVGITVWEHVLFAWPGIRHTIELWKADVQFPFIGYDILYGKS